MTYEDVTIQAMDELSEKHPEYAVAYLALVVRIIHIVNQQKLCNKRQKTGAIENNPINFGGSYDST